MRHGQFLSSELGWSGDRFVEATVVLWCLGIRAPEPLRKWLYMYLMFMAGTGDSQAY